MSRRAGMVVAGVAVTVGSLIGLPRAAHAGTRYRATSPSQAP